MLCIKDSKLVDTAKRMRWFGIDRKKKQLGIWENDVKEIGYKYQLTDLGASIGYQGLIDFKKMKVSFLKGGGFKKLKFGPSKAFIKTLKMTFTLKICKNVGKKVYF